MLWNLDTVESDGTSKRSIIRKELNPNCRDMRHKQGELERGGGGGENWITCHTP